MDIWVGFILGVYNSIMIIHVQVFVWTHIFFAFAYTPSSTILGHMLIGCLVFEELPFCIAKWLYHYTLLSVVYEFQFLDILTKFELLSVFFYCSHPNEYFFSFFFCLFGLFRASPWHMEVSRLGLNKSCSLQPQPQQLGIWSVSETYTTALGNAGSF